MNGYVKQMSLHGEYAFLTRQMGFRSQRTCPLLCWGGEC